MTPTQLATYVWVGQGLLSVVAFWGWTELADRIRSGDVAADLLRPVPPVTSYLAADLGRAAHAMATRFVPPLIVGLIFFPLYVPSRWWTVPLFAVSVVLAVVASFACRFLVNATAYWLHDARGPIDALDAVRRSAGRAVLPAAPAAGRAGRDAVGRHAVPGAAADAAGRAGRA